MNPILTKNYLAGAGIAKFRIAKLGSADGVAVQSATTADKLFGVFNIPGAALTGERVDVVRSGLADVEYGATIVRGDLLTTDADGKAVPANYVAGTAIYTIGQAEVSGAAGDIGKVLVVPGQLVNESQIVIADVTLTTAQVLALYTTPVSIIPAPGAGKALVPVYIQAMLDFNSIAYDGVASGEDMVLSYTNAAGTALAKFETTGFLDQGTDQMRYATPTQSGDTNLTPVANAAIVAHMLTGNIASGNSPVKLRVAYRVIDTAI